MQTLGRRFPKRSRTLLAISVVAVVVIAALSVRACNSTGPTAVATAPATATATSTALTIASPSGTAGASRSATPTASPIIASANPGLPVFDHVYVIIMENKEYGRIVGSSQAPYLNSLIGRYGLATNAFAATHPSQPNYIALTSGDLQGTTSDGAYNLDVPNLFDQIEASGRTWHVYAQGYPGNCFKSSIANPVKDGPGDVGEYVRKHNPAISYRSISGNPARCANITGFAGFDPAAADFELIVPNQINDMHSSSVAAGDAFLKLFAPSILDSPAFSNSLLIVTFDEGDSDVNGGGHIATILASPGMVPGTKFTPKIDHYAMLRTIELAWGMPLLAKAATATTIDIGY